MTEDFLCSCSINLSKVLDRASSLKLQLLKPLPKIGNRLKKLVPHNDVYRYGGDEFAQGKSLPAGKLIGN